jgi:hypothetical protein
MRYLITFHDSGKEIGAAMSKDAAIYRASWLAKQFDRRVNVYPQEVVGGDTGTRIVSCYKSGLLYEKDIADLPHNEYLARHATMRSK